MPDERTKRPDTRLIAGPTTGNLTPLAIAHFTPRELKPAIAPANRDPADHDRHQTGRNLAAFTGTMDTDYERMI